jgi:hypothetical protein
MSTIETDLPSSYTCMYTKSAYSFPPFIFAIPPSMASYRSECAMTVATSTDTHSNVGNNVSSGTGTLTGRQKKKIECTDTADTSTLCTFENVDICKIVLFSLQWWCSYFFGRWHGLGGCTATTQRETGIEEVLSLTLAKTLFLRYQSRWYYHKKSPFPTKELHRRRTLSLKRWHFQCTEVKDNTAKNDTHQRENGIIELWSHW